MRFGFPRVRHVAVGVLALVLVVREVVADFPEREWLIQDVQPSQLKRVSEPKAHSSQGDGKDASDSKKRHGREDEEVDEYGRPLPKRRPEIAMPVVEITEPKRTTKKKLEHGWATTEVFSPKQLQAVAAGKYRVPWDVAPLVEAARKPVEERLRGVVTRAMARAKRGASLRVSLETQTPAGRAPMIFVHQANLEPIPVKARFTARTAGGGGTLDARGPRSFTVVFGGKGLPVDDFAGAAARVKADIEKHIAAMESTRRPPKELLFVLELSADLVCMHVTAEYVSASGRPGVQTRRTGVVRSVVGRLTPVRRKLRRRANRDEDEGYEDEYDYGEGYDDDGDWGGGGRNRRNAGYGRNDYYNNYNRGNRFRSSGNAWANLLRGSVFLQLGANQDVVQPPEFRPILRTPGGFAPPVGVNVPVLNAPAFAGGGLLGGRPLGVRFAEAVREIAAEDSDNGGDSDFPDADAAYANMMMQGLRGGLVGLGGLQAAGGGGGTAVDGSAVAAPADAASAGGGSGAGFVAPAPGVVLGARLSPPTDGTPPEHRAAIPEADGGPGQYEFGASRPPIFLGLAADEKLEAVGAAFRGGAGGPASAGGPANNPALRGLIRDFALADAFRGSCDAAKMLALPHTLDHCAGLGGAAAAAVAARAAASVPLALAEACAARVRAGTEWTVRQAQRGTGGRPAVGHRVFVCEAGAWRDQRLAPAKAKERYAACLDRRATSDLAPLLPVGAGAARAQKDDESFYRIE